MNLGQLINEAVNQYNDQTGDNVGFRNNYSGRGMYGKKCVGITGSQSEVTAVMAQVIKDAFDKHEDAEEEIDFHEVVDIMLNFEQDSMGLDTIIYWRQVDPVVDGVEQFYENGQCPECGTDIPVGTITGEHCRECDHVFVEPTEDDDKQPN